METPAKAGKGVDVKAVQALQSKIIAAAVAYDITTLSVNVDASTFSISVTGTKKSA